MSLLDIVADKYETPVRGALSALSAPSPLRAAKAAKAPRPTRSELQEEEPSEHRDKSPVVSVDKWSKKLRESPDGELRRSAEDDWEEVSNDPAKLIAFADLLAITQIRESGGIPDNYTATTTCRRCGDVPIFERCLPRVDGCVWCMNGLTAPRIPGVKE